MKFKRTWLGIPAILLSGCFQSSVHGPVTEATVTVAPLAAPDNLLLSSRSGNIDDVKSAIGGKAYRDLGPWLQTLSLGFTEVGFDPEANGLYLITVSGGQDVDANRDLLQDATRTRIKGSWRAIATGKQLSGGLNNVTPLTEAVYQLLGEELLALSSKQAQQRLNQLAKVLLGEDVNGDGVINNKDVLRWTGIAHSDRLRHGALNGDRLALAIRNGDGDAVLWTLARRVAGAAPSLGLDTAFIRKRLPDGSCEGRGAAMVAANGESVTVLLPDEACGESDRVQVASASARDIALIELAANGLPSRVSLGEVTLALSNYKLGKGKLKLGLATGGETLASEVRVLKGRDELDRLRARYQLLKVSSGGSTLRYRDAEGAMMAYDRGAELAATDFAVADALAYGTLLSSWTACTVAEFLDDLEEASVDFPRELMDWSGAACTSPLVDIAPWVEKASLAVLNEVEAKVPLVEPEGCGSCYAEIESPAYGQLARVGEPVRFNGVVPVYRQSANWRFGDGNGAQGTSAEYSYSEAGEYEAKLIVDLADGSVAVQSVPVLVVPPGENCQRAPQADAGQDKEVEPGAAVALTGSGTAFTPPNCAIASYRWEQFAGPAVTIDNAEQALAVFEAPRLDEPVELGFRLTVEDSDGNTDSADTLITVPAASRCVSPPLVNAGPDRDVNVNPQAPEMITLFGEIEVDDDPACTLASYEWTQVDGLSVGSIMTGSDLPANLPPYSGGFITDIAPVNLEFQLTARDSEGNVASDRVKIRTFDGENYPRYFSRSYRAVAEFSVPGGAGYPLRIARCDARITLDIVEISADNYVTNSSPVTLFTSGQGLLGCHGDGEPPFDISTSLQRLEFKPYILSVGLNNGARVTAVLQSTSDESFNSSLNTFLQQSLSVDESGFYVPLVCQGVSACEGRLPEQ